jgi:hypothetical protein
LEEGEEVEKREVEREREKEEEEERTKPFFPVVCSSLLFSFLLFFFSPLIRGIACGEREETPKNKRKDKFPLRALPVPRERWLSANNKTKNDFEKIFASFFLRILY